MRSCWCKAQGSQSSTAFTKPFWTLTPLPLSQVRPGYTYPTTSLPSLQSLALNAISKDFHLFSPDDFRDLAPHLCTRVLERLKGDRVYDLDADRETHRPDEATLWAYQTLLDPTPLDPNTRGIALGLPTAITLRHLAPNPILARPDHPLVELPRLFRSIHAGADYTLLTGLSLGGLAGGVTDQSILGLRYCTHLSILKMTKCGITDDGIRMMATALDLPGPSDAAAGEGAGSSKGKGKEVERGMGMWRLRAWYLQGCTMVTDKAMQWFARWPGLVLLDVRDTSCTSAGSIIFNRASRALFASRNADFQPCTPGLLPLFANVATPRYIAEKLCILLGPPFADADPFSLHVIPSSREIQPSWLPPGTTSSPAAPRTTRVWGDAKMSVFRGEGIGQIYGAGVSRISDNASSFRHNVKTALFLTSRDEEEERDPRKREKRIREERAMWRKDYKSKQPPKAGQKDKDPYGRAATLVGGKKYKLKPGERDVIGPNATHDHSRTAYAVRKIHEAERAEEEKVKGDVEVMLVRMVCEGWEELTWAPEAGMELRRIAMGMSAGQAGVIASGSAASQECEPVSPRAGNGQEGGSGSQSVKVKIRAVDILGDIMSTSTSSQIKRQPVASAFRPSQSSQQYRSVRPSQSSQASASQSSQLGSQASSSPPQASSSPRAPYVTSTPVGSGNPFRSNPFKTSSSSGAAGVRPLPSSLTARADNRPTAVSNPACEEKVSARDGFAGFSKSASAKKRAFDGAGGEADGKRRGMKMFSGARL